MISHRNRRKPSAGRQISLHSRSQCSDEAEFWKNDGVITNYLRDYNGFCYLPRLFWALIWAPFWIRASATSTSVGRSETKWRGEFLVSGSKQFGSAPFFTKNNADFESSEKNTTMFQSGIDGEAMWYFQPLSMAFKRMDWPLEFVWFTSALCSSKVPARVSCCVERAKSSGSRSCSSTAFNLDLSWKEREKNCCKINAFKVQWGYATKETAGSIILF